MKTTLNWIGFTLIFAGYAFAILGTTDDNNEVQVISRIIVTLMNFGLICIGLPRLWNDIKKHRGSVD